MKKSNNYGARVEIDNLTRGEVNENSLFTLLTELKSGMVFLICVYYWLVVVVNVQDTRRWLISILLVNPRL